MNAVPAKKEPVIKTSISLPRSLFLRASKKAFKDGRAFSNHVAQVLQRDLDKVGAA